MFREMRKKPKRLSEERCIELQKEQTRCVLSVQGDDGYPYGVPINYWYNEENGKIYVHGGLIGHRVDAVRKNDKVCLTVFNQGYRNEGEWAYIVDSVIIFGRMTILTDKEENERICRQLCYRFTDDEEYINREIKGALARTLVMELTIEHMTGKRIRES